MLIDTAVKARIFKQLVTEWNLARGGEAVYSPALSAKQHAEVEFPAGNSQNVPFPLRV